MTYTIHHATPRKAGPHINSPTRLEWHIVGQVRADNEREAFLRACEATEEPSTTCISWDASAAEDRNALSFLAGMIAFLRRRLP